MRIVAYIRFAKLAAGMAVALACTAAHGDGIVAVHDWNDGTLQDWT